MKKILTIAVIAMSVLSGCSSASNWKLTSGKVPIADPDPIVFEGNAVLSGWGVEVAYYAGTPEIHFHVAPESIADLPQEVDFKKYDWNFKLENSTEDFNKVLANSTQTSKVEITVNKLTIAQEGHPILYLSQN
ncbi:MAG: hypothetical protein PHP74_01150 [Candidatus Gracilibacteria bacterium]|nr:hypothetical protein [Candidatus Gracilibacteria bacterium]